jgi:large subunit ribosomal protein LP0
MPGVSDKKRAYGQRLVDYIENYKSAFLVQCDNVGSKQMQQVRVALRGSAMVLMGKNVSTQRTASIAAVSMRRGSLQALNFVRPAAMGNSGGSLRASQCGIRDQRRGAGVPTSL